MPYEHKGEHTMAKSNATPNEPEDDKADDKKAPSAPAIETVEFNWRGTKYKVPKDRDDWPILAHRSIDARDYYAGIQALFGPAQWQTVNGNGQLSRREFHELATTLADFLNAECVG